MAGYRGGPRGDEPRTYEEGMKIGYPEGAREYFAAMIADDPENPDGHAGMGRALLYEDDERALEHLKKAVKLGDGRASTRVCLASACRALDMSREALKWYRAAQAELGDSALVPANAAYLHLRLGEPGEAAKSADEALRLEPELDDAKIVKGMALLESGKRGAGAALLAEAARERDYGSALLGMAYGLLHGGDDEGALKCLVGPVGEEPRDPQDRFKKGFLLSRSGDHAGAYEEYAAAARAERSAQICASMAASLTRLHGGGRGKKWRAEALGLISKAVADDPFGMYAGLEADCLLELADGRPRRGVRDVSEPRPVADREARLNMGAFLYIGGKDVPGALAHLKALVEDEPDFGEARYSLGIALHMAGAHEEALAQLREGLKLGADPESTYREMAEAYRALGMKREANKCERAIQEVWEKRWPKRRRKKS